MPELRDQTAPRASVPVDAVNGVRITVGISPMPTLGMLAFDSVQETGRLGAPTQLRDANVRGAQALQPSVKAGAGLHGGAPRYEPVRGAERALDGASLRDKRAPALHRAGIRETAEPGDSKP
jgi:hypothetical protein